LTRPSRAIRWAFCLWRRSCARISGTKFALSVHA